MQEQAIQAVNRLPLKLRTVFVMRYVEGKSYADICGQLGITVETLERLLTKGIARIASCMS